MLGRRSLAILAYTSSRVWLYLCCGCVVEQPIHSLLPDPGGRPPSSTKVLGRGDRSRGPVASFMSHIVDHKPFLELAKIVRKCISDDGIRRARRRLVVDGAIR